MKFICPECGMEDDIVQLTRNLVIVDHVVFTSDNLTLEYNRRIRENPFYEPTQTFECDNCGWELPVNTMGELVEWVDNQEEERTK